MERITNPRKRELKENVKILDMVEAFESGSVLGYPYDLDMKRGRCRCPHPQHADNDPSTAIYGEGMYYKCFACGEHGDVFSFTKNLMEKAKGEPVSMVDAFKAVAKVSGNYGYYFREETSEEKEEAKKEYLLAKAFPLTASDIELLSIKTSVRVFDPRYMRMDKPNGNALRVSMSSEEPLDYGYIGGHSETESLQSLYREDFEGFQYLIRNKCAERLAEMKYVVSKKTYLRYTKTQEGIYQIKNALRQNQEQILEILRKIEEAPAMVA
jgi:hypothetical protein